MSRKPTIDDTDDLDDEDGAVEDDREAETDLTLHEVPAEDVSAAPPLDEPAPDQRRR